VTVLIPAYEPSNKLIDLIYELQAKTDYKILIVDDGSGEKYKDIFNKASESGCCILSHEQNKGKGAALKTGFSYILENCPGENVVCADSDGQHRADDIIKVADKIGGSKTETEHENKIVLGIRQFDGNVPFKSKVGNRITSLLLKVVSGISLHDTQTGLRGYPFSMLEWLISQKGNRFEYELNLLIEAQNSGILITQIPILTIYENQNKGTHFHPLLDSVRVLLPILKFCASSLTSAILDFILWYIFQNLTGSLFLGVVLARIISSTYNFTINRLIVFKSGNISAKQSAPKYFSVVIVMMFLNYCVLAFLTNILGIHGIISKLLTEISLFTASYTFQRFFVFAGKHNKN